MLQEGLHDRDDLLGRLPLAEHYLGHTFALRAAQVEAGEIAHARQAHRPQTLGSVVHRDAAGGHVGEKLSQGILHACPFRRRQPLSFTDGAREHR